METRGEIKAYIKGKLMSTSNSSYFSDERIEAAIDNNYILVASMHDWDKKEKGFITSSGAGEEYYDFPENCESDSLIRLELDGVDYLKIDFKEYLNFKENPDTTKRYFAEYGRQYFIYPIPATTGEDNLTIWGNIQAANLTADAETTMFSGSESQINMAIAEYAYSELISPINQTAADKADLKAKGLIDTTWNKIAKRNQTAQYVDTVMFDVPDYYGGTTGVSKTGNF